MKSQGNTWLASLVTAASLLVACSSSHSGLDAGPGSDLGADATSTGCTGIVQIECRELCPFGSIPNTTCLTTGPSPVCDGIGWSCPSGSINALACNDLFCGSPVEDGGVPQDAPPCSGLSCNRVCPGAIDAQVCSSETVAANCDGSCRSGYAPAPTCTEFVSSCPGVDAGAPDWTSCSDNSDCGIRAASCCGSCGVATASDMIALNRAHLSEYGVATCGDDFACPPCFAEPDPNLVAVCESNQCVARDMRTTAIEACEEDSDCRVRVAECCECGSESTPPYIAINASQATAYESIVCVPGDCATDPPCSTYPDFPVARCTTPGPSGASYCYLDWGAD